MRRMFLYGLLAATMLSPTMAGAAETLTRPAETNIVTNPASLIEGTAQQWRERGDGSDDRGQGRGEGRSRWNRGSGAPAAQQPQPQVRTQQQAFPGFREQLRQAREQRDTAGAAPTDGAGYRQNAPQQSHNGGNWRQERRAAEASPPAERQWSGDSDRRRDRQRVRVNQSESTTPQQQEWNRDGERRRYGDSDRRWNRDVPAQSGWRNRNPDDWRTRESVGTRYDRDGNGQVDRRYDRNRDGRFDRRAHDYRPYYNGRSYNNWDYRWRDNNRYDWRSYRDRYENRYRIGRYYSPYRGYNYSRLSIGFFLDSMFFGSSYRIGNPGYYGLPPTYGPYRWVRYYDDVLLIDIRDGYVVDVIYDFFW